MMENSMSLNLRHMQQFPIINTQKMMVVDPSNLVKIHINSFQPDHQHQTIPMPMLDKIYDRIRGSTEYNEKTKAFS